MALSALMVVSKSVPVSGQRQRCGLAGTGMTIKESLAPEKFLGECPTEITFLGSRLDDETSECCDNEAT